MDTTWRTIHNPLISSSYHYMLMHHTLPLNKILNLKCVIGWFSQGSHGLVALSPPRVTPTSKLPSLPLWVVAFPSAIVSLLNLTTSLHFLLISNLYFIFFIFPPSCLFIFLLQYFYIKSIQVLKSEVLHKLKHTIGILIFYSLLLLRSWAGLKGISFRFFQVISIIPLFKLLLKL